MHKLVKAKMEKIKERQNEIEVLQKPLWEELRYLEDELLLMYNYEALQLARSLKWTLEYTQSEFFKVKLSSEDRDQRHLVNKQLWKLDGNYHKTFYITEEITLNMDDGELYLIFETVEDYLKYSKEWDLNVDTEFFKAKLNGFRTEINTLEKRLSE